MTNIIPCDSILIGGGGGSSDIAYCRPSNSIQTVSFASGDAIDQASNLFQHNMSGAVQSLDYAAATPMNTLINNNIFGNKTRFTNDSGVDVYGTNPSNTIIYDHLQGVIFDVVDFRNDNRRTLAAAWTLAQAKSESLDGGKTYANWYLTPIEYIFAVCDDNQTATEPRLFNTLGSGTLCQSNTYHNDGVSRYYVSNNSSNSVLLDTSTNFNSIYMTFIEDYV